MSFKKLAGTLIGGGIGFLVGGPAGAVKGASLGAGVDASRAQTSAIKEGTAAANAAQDQAIGLQREMFERNIQLQEPFRQAGVNALAKLEPLASNYTPFGMDQFQADPGYAFRMSEGMKGLERSAAARGGLLSGSTLKGIQRFGQDLGSQEYQNAFKRYQIEREARLAPLQSLAGVGQTSANTMGQTNTGFANTVGGLYGQQGMNTGNAMMAAGQARASAYGGAFNALGRMYGSGAFGSGGGSGGFTDVGGMGAASNDVLRQYGI
jgi:hypothetical protein